MAGMGPAPKHPDQRVRRNATFAMTRLPAEGRKGRAPKWPLGGDLKIETEIHFAKRSLADLDDELGWSTSARDRSAIRRKMARAKKAIAEREAMLKFAAKVEREIWTQLWKTPQAVQWEKLGWDREVAQYARHKAKAEGGSLPDQQEARQLSDRLGLSPLALLRLRWEIVDAAAATSTRPTSRARATKYRNLRVVGS